jgi:hypothetical protein
MRRENELSLPSAGQRIGGGVSGAPRGFTPARLGVPSEVA